MPKERIYKGDLCNKSFLEKYHNFKYKGRNLSLPCKASIKFNVDYYFCRTCIKKIINEGKK